MLRRRRAAEVRALLSALLGWREEDWDHGWGPGGGSCRQGLRWSFKMALRSWRNVEQLVGSASSTALSR